MLYWPKLLVTAHAITCAVEVFLPLFIIAQLELPLLPAAGLFASIYFLRLFSGCWATLIDNRPQLYGLVIAGFAILSSFSFITLLSIYRPDTIRFNTWDWFIISSCCIINGLFYQSLGILIDSAIIKILGDYRVLFYGSYKRWSQSITIMSVLLVGWLVSMTEEKYLNNILVAVWTLSTAMLLFIAITYTVVVPANSEELDISEEQGPLLLKNALYLTADQTKFPFAYKPYSIFGEQLSHISEEDSSQLDRVFTVEDSIRRVTSYDSTPSYYSSPSHIGTAGGGLHHYSRHSDIEVVNDLSDSVCINSSTLAVLPLPSSTDPLIALWTARDSDVYDIQTAYYTQNVIAVTKQKNWKTQTLTLTLLLLGLSYALINTFLVVYLYIILEISIPIISVYIVMQILGDIIVSKVIEKWFIQCLNLTLITTCAHITLILCAMIYPILKPNSTVTQIVLAVLQLLQAIAFQLMWFGASYAVNDVSFNYYDHIKQQARLSATYSSIGPTIGTLLAGYFLCGNNSLDDYAVIFKVSVALFSASFVISWGWTSDD